MFYQMAQTRSKCLRRMKKKIEINSIIYFYPIVNQIYCRTDCFVLHLCEIDRSHACLIWCEYDVVCVYLVIRQNMCANETRPRILNIIIIWNGCYMDLCFLLVACMTSRNRIKYYDIRIIRLQSHTERVLVIRLLLDSCRFTAFINRIDATQQRQFSIVALFVCIHFEFLHFTFRFIFIIISLVIFLRPNAPNLMLI